MNLETTRLRCRLRNGWEDEVRKDGRLVGGIGWRERVHNREEWKKLLRTERNHCILHMPMNELTVRMTQYHTRKNMITLFKIISHIVLDRFTSQKIFKTRVSCTCTVPALLRCFVRGDCSSARLSGSK